MKYFANCPLLAKVLCLTESLVIHALEICNIPTEYVMDVNSHVKLDLVVSVVLLMAMTALSELRTAYNPASLGQFVMLFS